MGIDRFSLNDFRSVIYDLPLYFEQDTARNEYIFTATLGEIEDVSVSLRICSSISATTDRARTDGDDAIRVQFTDPYGDTLVLDGQRYRHIKRKSGWDERLTDRVAEYRGKFPTIIECCPECGRPLKIKGGSSGRFKGCTGWAPDDADCSYTSDF